MESRGGATVAIGRTKAARDRANIVAAGAGRIAQNGSRKAAWTAVAGVVALLCCPKRKCSTHWAGASASSRPTTSAILDGPAAGMTIPDMSVACELDSVEAVAGATAWSDIDGHA